MEQEVNDPQAQQGRGLNQVMQSEIQQQQQQANINPQAPMKCPRCESLNTKFCYYNNYSQNQPRYFCKNCRRYWTKGGTLRNVPVGGSCRKGNKRARASSSSAPPVQPQPVHIISKLPGMDSGNQDPRTKDLGTFGFPVANLPASSYNSGGGFLSLAGIQSMNRPNFFTQAAIHGGGQYDGASNIALLQGFNNFPSSSSPQVQNQQQSDQAYLMGNRDKNIEEPPLYPSDQRFNHPNISLGSWTQSFINNWNTTTTTTSNNTMNGGASGSSMNPNQWPDLPGYDPSA